MLLTIFFSLPFFAQKSVEVALKLRDGSNIFGTTLLPDISLITSYGKLVIPLQNVSAIRVGIPTDKTTTTKVQSLLKMLSSSEEPVRKGAFAEIMTIGIRAIPAISDFINSPSNTSEYSGEYTPDKALSDLMGIYNIDPASSNLDEVTIDNLYLIGGIYDFQKLEVKTEYGTLNIPKEKINNIDVTSIISNNLYEFAFRLKASQNISANPNGGWLRTGINLKSGQKFSIFSNGAVYLASLSGQKFQPSGSIENANLDKNLAIDDYNSATTVPTFGMVVYKIGEITTTPTKAGSKFTGVASESGMLYISIYETVFNTGNSGSYSVKVTLK